MVTIPRAQTNLFLTLPKIINSYIYVIARLMLMLMKILVNLTALYECIQQCLNCQSEFVDSVYSKVVFHQSEKYKPSYIKKIVF